MTFVAHWLERLVRAGGRERESTKCRRTAQNGMGIKTTISRLDAEREVGGASEMERMESAGMYTGFLLSDAEHIWICSTLHMTR